jgi:hypothetical protein
MVSDRIRKLHSTRACSGGVVSFLRNPSGGHMRGRGERGGGGRRTREVILKPTSLILATPIVHYLINKDTGTWNDKNVHAFFDSDMAA